MKNKQNHSRWAVIDYLILSIKFKIHRGFVKNKNCNFSLLSSISKKLKPYSMQCLKYNLQKLCFEHFLSKWLINSPNWFCVSKVDFICCASAILCSNSRNSGSIVLNVNPTFKQTSPIIAERNKDAGLTNFQHFLMPWNV